MCDQTGEPVHEASELDTESMHQLHIVLLELVNDLRELQNKFTETSRVVREGYTRRRNKLTALRNDINDFRQDFRKAFAGIRCEIQMFEKEEEERHSKRMCLLSNLGRLEFS